MPDFIEPALRDAAHAGGARRAVGARDQCDGIPQNISEFWNVATRPQARNGAWLFDRTRALLSSSGGNRNEVTSRMGPR